jgi:hypothetical protein
VPPLLKSKILSSFFLQRTLAEFGAANTPESVLPTPTSISSSVTAVPPHLQTQYRATTPPVVVSPTPPHASSYANGSSHSYTSTPLNHGYGQQQQQGYQSQYQHSGQDVPTPSMQTPSPNLTDTLASIPDEQKVRPQSPPPPSHPLVKNLSKLSGLSVFVGTHPTRVGYDT